MEYSDDELSRYEVQKRISDCKLRLALGYRREMKTIVRDNQYDDLKRIRAWLEAGWRADLERLIAYGEECLSQEVEQ